MFECVCLYIENYEFIDVLEDSTANSCSAAPAALPSAPVSVPSVLVTKDDGKIDGLMAAVIVVAVALAALTLFVFIMIGRERSGQPMFMKI